MNRFIIFRILNVLLFLSLKKGYGATSKKTWTFEMKSINTKTSNKDLLDSNFHIERVSRGVFALSGELKMNYDIKEGDQNEIEAKSYRSPLSNGDYQTLPLMMTRRHWHKTLNTYYKDILMETFKNCSDLPYFKDKFVPPIEKRTYTLNKCAISQDGLPNHLELGMYKIVVTGYGDVEWQLEFFAEVESSF